MIIRVIEVKVAYGYWHREWNQRAGFKSFKLFVLIVLGKSCMYFSVRCELNRRANLKGRQFWIPDRDEVIEKQLHTLSQLENIAVHKYKRKRIWREPCSPTSCKENGIRNEVFRNSIGCDLSFDANAWDLSESVAMPYQDAFLFPPRTWDRDQLSCK